MELQGGKYTTTTDVWNMLAASRAGDLDRVNSLVAVTPGLVRCEHNYMPPLHLAVREGHRDLVLFLLERGAFDREHVTYPYNEKLLTLAEDRDDAEITRLLREYASKPPTTCADGKAVHGVGTIQFPADDDVNRLEKLVGANALSAVEKGSTFATGHHELSALIAKVSPRSKASSLTNTVSRSPTSRRS